MLREVFTRVKIKVFVTKAYYEDSDQTYDRYYAVQIFGIWYQILSKIIWCYNIDKKSKYKLKEIFDFWNLIKNIRDS